MFVEGNCSFGNPLITLEGWALSCSSLPFLFALRNIPIAALVHMPFPECGSLPPPRHKLPPRLSVDSIATPSRPPRFLVAVACAIFSPSIRILKNHAHSPPRSRRHSRLRRYDPPHRLCPSHPRTSARAAIRSSTAVFPGHRRRQKNSSATANPTKFSPANSTTPASRANTGATVSVKSAPWA